jgi:DNA-binding beta-propeller fold protein YncE
VIRTAAVAGLGVLATACVQRTEVMLVIDAEPAVRRDAVQVEVAVTGPDGRSDASFAAGWPIRLALVPKHGDASRRFAVEASALGAGGGLIAVQRLQSGYLAGRTLALTIVFSDACSGVACQESTTCEASTGDPRCVASPFVDPTTLADFEPTAEVAPEAGVGPPTPADAAIEDAGPSDGAAADAGPAPPTVALAFPTGEALTGLSAIDVAGTATSAGAITRLRVNWADATSSDGFRHWRVSALPLSPGANPLVATVVDDSGRTSTAALGVVVQREPISGPRGLAYDGSGGRLLVAESNRIAALDLTTFAVTELYRLDAYGWLAAVAATSAAYCPLGSTCVAQALEVGRGFELVELDSSGGRIWSGLSRSDFFLSDPTDLAFDPSSGDLYCLGLGFQLLRIAQGGFGIQTVKVMPPDPGAHTTHLTIDPATGQAYVLAGSTIHRLELGAATHSVFATCLDPGAEYTGLALDLDRRRLLVADATHARLVGVDLGNAACAAVSGGGAGSGPDFELPLALTASRARAYVGEPARILAVDLVSGDRTVLYDSRVGSGPPVLAALAADERRGTVLATLSSSDTIGEIDLSSGERRPGPSGLVAAIPDSAAYAPGGERVDFVSRRPR